MSVSDLAVSAKLETEGDGGDLTYSGPITGYFSIKVSWRSGSIGHQVSGGGTVHGRVGPSGMDPETARFRELAREAMRLELERLARAVKRQTGTSTQEVMALGRKAVWNASGESGEPSGRGLRSE